MRRFFAIALGLALLTGCNLMPSQAELNTRIENSVQATLLASTAPVVTVEVPVTIEVPVQVPVTVQVLVTTTPEPTINPDAPTPVPEDLPLAGSPQDPLAGANLIPLFSEDFLAPDYWDEFDNDFGRGAIENEVYVLVNRRTERLVWAVNGRRGTDFYYSVTAQFPTGCRERDNLGLLFRVTDSSNFYAFGISCEGRYRLLRQVDGIFQVILDWTPNDAIGRLDAVNRLGVRAEGSAISLYANDTFLAQVNDLTFNGGRFGFYVGSWLTTDLTAVFDDAVAYPIP